MQYTYDSLSRTTAVNYYRSGSFVGSMAYVYQNKYDPNEDHLGQRIKQINYCCNPNHSISYTYDDVGNIVSTNVGGNYGWAYDYDNIYQVTSADQGSATNRAIDWNYDKVYNRTYWYDSIYGSTNYQDNALHQYLQVGAVTPAYDSKGNITSGYGGGLTLVYDCENRLTTAGSVSYAYDWLGRRVSRTVSGGTTTYVYDGGQIIAEYDGGTLLRKYIYGPGIDEPVCMVASGGTYYYHFDGLGSVAALTDSGGTLVEKYRYDAFGGTTILAPNNQTRTTSLYGNRFMFTGREWDSTTQLYYYRARDYSPTLGRFLQPDPIGYADSMNLYQYCGNNPVNFIDPWGLKIEFQWHFPYREINPNSFHGLIRITPEDQGKWANHPDFKNNIDSQGRHYMTLGAGPDLLGNLKSKPNRDSDKAPHSAGYDLNPGNSCEDYIIEQLIEKDKNYKDNQDYDAFSEKESERKWYVADDGYNSNSYIRGLLQSVHGDNAIFDNPVIQQRFPGIQNPLPPSCFEP